MKIFVKGEKSKLADLTPATTLTVGIGIASSANMTFDVSCFGVDDQDKLSDDRYMIFFNQKASPEGAINMSEGMAGDHTRFNLDLSRVPAFLKKMVFTITIDGAGIMSQISSGHVRVVANGEEIARYPFSGVDFQNEKAIIAAQVYFKDIWRFNAVGQGFNGGLSALLKHFGGEEAAPAAPPPPPPAPSINLKKITLDKSGDSRTVDLNKSQSSGGGMSFDLTSNKIHINLNWNSKRMATARGGPTYMGDAKPDLDLGCMYRMRNGEMGCIQPVGGDFGSAKTPPYIFLDKDDKTGEAEDGENMYIFRPDLIDFVMVFGLIYQGAASYQEVDATMTIHDPAGHEITIKLDNPDPYRRFCSVCTIRNVGNQVMITKEELYFRGHPEADQHFGFGFRWVAGDKEDN